VSWPLEFTHDLSALANGPQTWVVTELGFTSARTLERMMKLQDVILKGMAKKIRLAGRGGDHRSFAIEPGLRELFG
jgi:hypothetical protein